MKKYKFNIASAFLVLVFGMLFFTACEEPEEAFGETRLFQPVLSQDLFAIDNTIIVDMAKMKRASSYTIEVSRDTFKTLVMETMQVDTNYVVIEDLLWNTIYQVRAKANHPNDPNMNSKGPEAMEGFTLLGNVKTKRYPSILNIPTADDVTDTEARISWVTSGAPVTTVKIFAASDERLENPLDEFEIDEEEIAKGVKIVSGLDQTTKYQIALYSGEDLRGWVDYTTRVSIEGIDLRGLPASSLADTLPDVPDGANILLEKGVVYPTGGYKFDKSVSIMSGYSFVTEPATIDCSSNFNLAPGASVGFVKFKDVLLTGVMGDNYVFNINEDGNIGELEFDGCRIHSLRGILRAKDGKTGTISKYSIVNSFVDSIGNYGVMTMDIDPSATNPGFVMGDILLKNSTFAKLEAFLTSRTNTNSLTIEDCTISQGIKAGQNLLRWRGGAGNNNITNGVTIKNTLLGPGWDMAGTGAAANFKGFDGLTETNFSVVNSYKTSDFEFSANEIPGFTLYNKTAQDLWIAPFEELNFFIEDSGFTAKNSAGDPRWRPGL